MARGPHKSLYLLRHAKSDWGDPALDDHDRPLNARGERAARAMGVHLEETGARPDLVLCSTARRAVDTLDLVLTSLTSAPPVRLERALYLAAPESLLEHLRAQGDGPGAILLVGHNPGLGELADRLAAPEHSDARRRLARKVPTGALAELHFDVSSWGDIAAGAGALHRFVRPRDL